MTETQVGKLSPQEEQKLSDLSQKAQLNEGEKKELIQLQQKQIKFLEAQTPVVLSEEEERRFTQLKEQDQFDVLNKDEKEELKDLEQKAQLSGFLKESTNINTNEDFSWSDFERFQELQEHFSDGEEDEFLDLQEKAYVAMQRPNVETDLSVKEKARLSQLAN